MDKEGELNHKLAEWAGFIEIVQLGSCLCGYPPNFTWDKNWNKPSIGMFPIPDFPNDLNACFKWLVPKLIEQDKWVRLEVVSGSLEGFVEIRDWNNKLYAESGIEETPALALCKAIEKLIDNEHVKS